jgi:hypothetical protein
MSAANTTLLVLALFVSTLTLGYRQDDSAARSNPFGDTRRVSAGVGDPVERPWPNRKSKRRFRRTISRLTGVWRRPDHSSDAR